MRRRQPTTARRTPPPDLQRFEQARWDVLPAAPTAEFVQAFASGRGDGRSLSEAWATWRYVKARMEFGRARRRWHVDNGVWR